MSKMRLPVQDLYAEAVKNDDGSLRNYFARVSGSSFRCDCGCNVFHKPDKKDLELYRCNGCDADYRGA